MKENVKYHKKKPSSASISLCQHSGHLYHLPGFSVPSCSTWICMQKEIPTFSNNIKCTLQFYKGYFFFKRKTHPLPSNNILEQKKSNSLLVTSILWCLTLSHSLVHISAQVSKSGCSSSTVSLQPALRMRLWESYRKLSTKAKEKPHSAKIMTFRHLSLPLEENYIHLLSTTALPWSTDKKSIPKRKVGAVSSRESHRKPKCSERKETFALPGPLRGMGTLSLGGRKIYSGRKNWKDTDCPNEFLFLLLAIPTNASLTKGRMMLHV